MTSLSPASEREGARHRERERERERTEILLGVFGSMLPHHTFVPELKGNNFMHENLFTGLEEYYCICEKSCIKPFVAPEGAS